MGVTGLMSKPTPEWVIEQMRETLLKLKEEKDILTLRYEELVKVNADLLDKLSATDRWRRDRGSF